MSDATLHPLVGAPGPGPAVTEAGPVPGGWASPAPVPGCLPQALSAVHSAQLSPWENLHPFFWFLQNFCWAFLKPGLPRPADRFSEDVLHPQCDGQLADLPELITTYRNSFFSS